jgi:hypothetical protein
MIVNDLIKKLIDPDCPEMRDANELSRYLVTLSAYLWEAGIKMTDSEVKYNKRLSEVRPLYKTDRQAEVFMKSQPEYVEMEHAKHAKVVILETTRSLKKRIDVLREEYKEATF